MTNVIKFPCSDSKNEHEERKSQQELTKPWLLYFTAGVLKAFWIVLVMFWTPVKWILAIDVGMQCIKMLFKWHESGLMAAVPFIAHFALLTALTYFVSCWKPTNLDKS